MIINNTPQNEAVLSNVGEIGEFRIRNSAKAFSILSSGLYANKIRAIIRELSCNAVDSHVAAGKSDVPFDVHLPNQLEPYFNIRDYGTGLTHEQVTQIYTTYFESTKTNSNEFIGALGLGSKSPFSYTDNFTVTAIKDGVRGVYSAFINNEGVPSIALMHTESTDQPSGVEIQFAVNDHYDFRKFEDEARYVYTYFKLRPVISGKSDFTFREVEYHDKDIIPGVHYITSSRSHTQSRAVMGNIAYPIEVPNADSVLGDLHSLLDCGLEMHFNIGELDFQASREGLSYIPQTINSIKAKLTELNSALYSHLAKELAEITNLWDKAEFIMTKSEQKLWFAAARQYVVDNKFDLIDAQSSSYRLSYSNINFTEKELAKKFNIQVTAFQKGSGYNTCSALKADKKYKNGGYVDFDYVWSVTPSPNFFFVVNDTKTGAYTRATYHWRYSRDLPKTSRNHMVMVLQAADKNKPMNTNKFFAALRGPKVERILKASTLLQKERAAPTARSTDHVSILRMETKNYSRGRSDSTGWGEGGCASDFDSKNTYYYIPLSGYTALGKVTDVKYLYKCLESCGLSDLAQITIYGVRKSDIEIIKTQKNWVNLDEHLTRVLNSLTPETVSNLVLSELDNSTVVRYNSDIASRVADAKSPYLSLVSKFKNVTRIHYSHSYLRYLLTQYAPTVTLDPLVQALRTEIDAVQARYPLLYNIRNYDYCSTDIAEYINLIDKSKGV